MKYLNNKDLLKQIHISKMSYSWYKNKDYFFYDVIVDDLYNISQELKREAEKKCLDRLELEKTDENIASIQDKIVYRIVTYEHIPEDPKRKSKPKSIADRHVKINFPSFKHYIQQNDGYKEVARSHWKGDLETGKFSFTHGNISDELARMFLKLCERYATRSNWRGYTYVDEMRSQAILQLTIMGLQFDESKSQNPFAYYTAAITNSFTRILNTEKRSQVIRDDLLVNAGYTPSYTRQVEDMLATQTTQNDVF
jgi:hypothetical protein